MPTRIYALAKDLKIDSKDLVDICTRAGIPGKGSALASLDDVEMAKLKAYMDGASAKKAVAPAQPLVNTRDVLSTPVAGTQILPPPPRPVRPKAADAPAAAVETPAAEPAEEIVPEVPVAGPRGGLDVAGAGRRTHCRVRAETFRLRRALFVAFNRTKRKPGSLFPGSRAFVSIR